MLKLLRTHTKTIIWIVILCFCLWGGYAVGTSLQKQGRVAGQIFGKDIQYPEFDAFYKANQIFAFGGKKPPEDPNLLQIQTWQSLIFAYEAKNQGVKISDQEVRDEVMRLLKDLDIQSPTPEFYERWLMSSFRMTPQEFENTLREVLRIQKMMNQLNSAPLPEPDPALLRDRFEREQNSLDLDLAPFETEAEAKTFYETVRSKPAAFDAEIKSRNLKIQTTGKIALDAILNLWQVPRPVADQLLAAEKGTLSEPFPRSGKFAVARLKEKQAADPSKFDEAMKKKIADQLKNQSRYERFIKWSIELEARADLKDFTPQSLTQKPVEGPKASAENPASPSAETAPPAPDAVSAASSSPAPEKSESPAP